MATIQQTFSFTRTVQHTKIGIEDKPATISWSISGNQVTWNIYLPMYQDTYRSAADRQLYALCQTGGVKKIYLNYTFNNGAEQTEKSSVNYYSEGAGPFTKTPIYVSAINLTETVPLTTSAYKLKAGFESDSSVYYELSQQLAWNVTYNANGGTGTTATQIKKANQALTISANSFTRTNYVFSGWNTQANGSGTSVSPGFSYTDNAPLMLYAQWTEVNIPVYMNINNSIVQIEKAYYNDSGTIKECDIYLNDGGTLRLIK